MFCTYTRDTLGMLLRHTLDTLFKHSGDTLDILLRHTKDTPGILLGYTRNTPDPCYRHPRDTLGILITRSCSGLRGCSHITNTPGILITQPLSSSGPQRSSAQIHQPTPMILTAYSSDTAGKDITDTRDTLGYTQHIPPEYSGLTH